MIEYAYNSNDNDISIQFFINGLPANLSGSSKVSIEFFAKESDRIRGVDPAAEFNSFDNPTLFDITDLLNGKVVFKPGPSDLLPLLIGSYYTRWLVYNVVYDDGLVWGNGLIKYIVAR